jgi:hypothetical protein
MCEGATGIYRIEMWEEAALVHVEQELGRGSGGRQGRGAAAFL